MSDDVATIKRLRAYIQTQQQIFMASSLLHNAGNVEEVGKVITDILIELTGAKSGAVILFPEDSKDLSKIEVVAKFGVDDNIDILDEADLNLIHMVLKSGNSIFSDAMTQTDFSYKPKSLIPMICLALKASHGTIGTIVIFSNSTRTKVLDTDHNYHFFSMLASQATSAFEVLRMHARVSVAQAAALEVGNKKLLVEIERRKRLEDKLREKSEMAFEIEKKAVAALEAKSTFLATMSHEIRTPMNAILGFANLLFDEEEDVEKKEQLKIILNSGEGLLCIMNDILDIAKLESGHVSIEKTEFDVVEILNSTIKIFENEAAMKLISLELDVDQGIGQNYLGDPHRLRQILINLIGNAVKFTTQGGVIVKVFSQGRGLRFQVIDSGIGIQKRNLSKIFKSFTQAEGSTTREFGGAGLGLSIVRKIVQLWDGKINVTSKFGEGTTFSVTLPIARSEAKVVHHVYEHQNSQDSRQDATELKILVCEDNAVNLDLMKKWLEKYDIKFDTAANGKLGFELYKLNNYSLILMDIRMPVMDGLEATKIIRKYEVNKNINPTPIIAVTANVLKEDVDNYLSCGFDAHLPKPVRQKELHEIIMYWSDAGKRENSAA